MDPIPGADAALPVLTSGVIQIGVPLSDQQVSLFTGFGAILLDWNQKMNLTTITEPTAVQVRHFLDSLTVLKAFPEQVQNGQETARLIDVGAGAGLPGIPLAIARTNLQITLLEATQKKCRFLEHVIGELGLSNARVICGRAEEVAHRSDQRSTYDFVVARAVASLATLSELCLPFARLGGEVIAMKKLGVDEEVVSAKKAISVLGGQLLSPMLVRLPVIDEDRQLIRIRKVRPTPGTYPRRAGLPAKSPL